jgi:hypothetical protein
MPISMQTHQTDSPVHYTVRFIRSDILRSLKLTAAGISVALYLSFLQTSPRTGRDLPLDSQNEGHYQAPLSSVYPGDEVRSVAEMAVAKNEACAQRPSSSPMLLDLAKKVDQNDQRAYAEL